MHCIYLLHLMQVIRSNMPAAKFTGVVSAWGPQGVMGNKVDRDYPVLGTITSVSLTYDLEGEGNASQVTGKRGHANHEIIPGNKVRVHAWVDAGTRLTYTLEVQHA